MVAMPQDYLDFVNGISLRYIHYLDSELGHCLLMQTLVTYTECSRVDFLFTKIDKIQPLSPVVKQTSTRVHLPL